MYRITLALGGLEDADLARKAVGVLVSALVDVDALYLRDHPEAEARLASIRSHASPQGAKEAGAIFVQDVPTSIAEGFASPIDRLAWRIALLRSRGIKAVPLIGTRSLGRGRYAHRVAILLPQGISPGAGNTAEIVTSPILRATFVIGLFEGDREKALSDASLQVLLDALAEIDQRYLEKHARTPRIYQSGIVYQEEPPGVEDWQDIATCLRMGKADCDDLGPWLAAERRVRDRMPARPVSTSQKRKDGGTLYHIVVKRQDGRVEDPSKILGMR